MIQNVGNGAYQLPVSRETKLLHAEGNGDRRLFECGMLLSLKDSNTLTRSGYLTAYTSSGDPSSRMELKPGDSVAVTYEADFRTALFLSDSKWMSYIRTGNVSAAMHCRQSEFTPHPNHAKEERFYIRHLSNGVDSTNSVPLTLKP